MSSATSTAMRYLREWWTPLILSVAIVLTWLLVEASGSLTIQEDAMRLLLWMMLVVGLQIFSGNSGVMSFGHVAFMAMGAYFAALLTMSPAIKQTSFADMPGFLASWIHPAELSLFEAALAAGGLALVLAAIFGVAIARLSGVAAAIATHAILVIVNTFIVQTPAVTGGSDVIVGVPRATTIGTASLVLVGLVFGAYAFKRSRIGLRLRASRENEDAAKSVAVNVHRERYIAFVLSGFVFGIAGALYAHYFTGFAPPDFYFPITFTIVAMLVVGGMQSVSGAVVGTYFMSVIYLAARRGEVDGVFGINPPSGTAYLLLAIALLLALLLRPSGITGGKEVPWPGALLRRKRQVGAGTDTVAPEVKDAIAGGSSSSDVKEAAGDGPERSPRARTGGAA
jgi:branched-chain amino acid transport system permease protein